MAIATKQSALAVSNIQPFSLVWLKRDLRLRDHKPLCDAIALGNPIVIGYIIEPLQLSDPHMDTRHWRFICQSISDLNDQLSPFDTAISIFQEDMINVVEALADKGLSHIFSHQEVGLESSYQRDIKLAPWCKQNDVRWEESSYNAVKRPLHHRYAWRKHWYKQISASVLDPVLGDITPYKKDLRFHVPLQHLPEEWLSPSISFQPGGEKRAWYTLHDFFKVRGKRYFGNIGKPEQARTTCSRLSPYLAWGNISIRQVFQQALEHREREGWTRSVEAFCARLSWHCHFIQKFESEHYMQFRPVNKAYIHFEYDHSASSQKLLDAWKQGNTGVPIVDASMRALIATGYLNFRMRAMLVSFLCHHLNIDWLRGVDHLGKLFLDFEPGIHYPQFQMQAGITGTNTIRIYSPIKQSQEKDPEGVFIRKWVPEIACLPNHYIHEPASMPPLEAAMHNINIERDYCLPIVDVVLAAKKARDRLWAFRKRDDVKHEAKRVLHKHSVLN
ncbi:MAG: deoxyribodipyrimidine photo-lyase [Alphaproteobacteria bacterium]|jgi:deoxyribodipyrimidine photo-lyase